jgi:hypothetical protein
MPRMIVRIALLVSLALIACSPPATSSPPVQPTPPVTEQPPPGDLKPDGSACLLATECSSGVCEGEGCTDDKPGTCAPASRGCTRDLRPYCGCDGQTFRTSGSCPGKRFSARLECPAI